MLDKFWIWQLETSAVLQVNFVCLHYLDPHFCLDSEYGMLDRCCIGNLETIAALQVNFVCLRYVDKYFTEISNMDH